MKTKSTFTNPIGYFLAFLLGLILTSSFYAHYFLFTKSVEFQNPVTATISDLDQTDVLVITKTVPIVAVDQVGEQGHIGKLTLKLIPGNSNVLIATNPFLEPDLQYSANIAITLAKVRTEQYSPHKDFVLQYEILGNVVGGGSAGAATAIAAIAALTDKKIKENIAITGTINPDGSIGPVGGILEKAKAVADAGYTTFLIPTGQTKLQYYEKVVEKKPFQGGTVYNTKYVPKVVDMQKEIESQYRLKLIEIATIEDVEKLMLRS